MQDFSNKRKQTPGNAKVLFWEDRGWEGRTVPSDIHGAYLTGWLEAEETWCIITLTLSHCRQHQPEWLKLNIQCKKKCLPLRDSERLQRLISWCVNGASVKEPVPPASFSATVYAFQLPKQFNEELTVVTMCQMILWMNNCYFTGILLLLQWAGPGMDRVIAGY